ncbi:MAG: hypothetical protein JWQ73_2215 [Variovorax sp.]|nr:hypothetical protein [Variovorax sp.]
MSSFVAKSGTVMTLKAYIGDAKTLLAMNIPKKKDIDHLAGFTIGYTANGQGPFYIHNTLRFEKPAGHAQVSAQPANASVNSPIHKFRWIHVPGSVHQGLAPFMGAYQYTVTPRYFDAQNRLRPMDAALGVSVTVSVGPFESNGMALGFTRGFTQSQAFVNHFGSSALIRPAGDELLFDTSVVSGADASGQQYTFEQEYEWLGFTARQKILGLLAEVVGNTSLYLDVFAYDLDEPAFATALLTLAKEGRVRVILDNAALHHSTTKPKPEDVFEGLFRDAAKNKTDAMGPRRADQPADILRGKFGRYAHDKVLVVSDGDKPVKVLTGSTNFSVTGLYVNSNHVLVFSDPVVSAKYGELFDTAWAGKASRPQYLKTALSNQVFTKAKTSITFAPHTEAFAAQVLDGVAARIIKEGAKSKGKGSVLFAVMQVDQGTSPVYTELRALHANQKIFSYGISDTTSGIALYEPGRKTGVLVTGKPVKSQLPPPFNQVRNIGGVGHQVHHKFVVCGFNGTDPVVYCGSSNLALGGETENGDNLLEIHDEGVATAFAIEAIGLVDHFEFLDRLPLTSATAKSKAPAAETQAAAASAGWFLSVTDRWTRPYYDSNDLRFVDRVLFA